MSAAVLPVSAGRVRAGAQRLGAAVLLATGLAAAAPAGAQTAYDPFEPLNRSVFEFNDWADRYIVKPVAEGYVAVVPQLVRTGVGNFFGNIDDFFSGVNNALQWKPVQAGQDFGRVMVNTFFGLLGVIDIASDIGIERHSEDFGQTFGWWGAGPGPYFVLPLLGPSSLRDATGIGVRFVLDPLFTTPRGVSWGLSAVYLVDVRARLLGTETVLEQAALDKYRFTRSGFLQRRRYEIHDGSPPALPDNEE